MKEFEFKLNEARTELEFGVVGTPPIVLTAGELDRFMPALAAARASMQPPVPRDRLNEKSLVSAVPAVRWHVTLDEIVPTGIRIYFLHLAWGWMWLPLDEANANKLRNAIQNNLQHRPRLS